MFWKIFGIKEIRFKHKFIIKGQKEKSIKTLFTMAGKKITNLEKAYVATAILEKELQNLLSLRGRKSIKLIHPIDIKDKKQTKYIGDVITVGSKQFNFGTENPVYATKQTLYNRKDYILGKKEINLKKEMSIKGKRDKTNILLALDLV